MPISRTRIDAVAVLALDLGRGNAINHPFIDALNAALDELEQDGDVRALVLTGAGRAFSAGLDLVETYAYDLPALGRYVDAFDALFVRVAAFPWPVVAAVNGHAIAGGCILALAADFRIMADGPFLIGLNEVALGIPFPAGAFEVARRGVPAQAQAEAFLEGRLYRPAEARDAGLVHRLLPPGTDLLAAALEHARRLAAGSPEALRATKADLLAPLLSAVDATRAARRARLLEAWYWPETRARIGRVRDDLTRKPR